MNNPDSPFAHLAYKFKSKTNSSPPLASNPRAEFARAENALQIARTNLIAATRAAGKSIGGLFKDSRFILRTSGEKWVYQAEEGFLEREKENFKYVAMAIEKLGPGIPDPTTTARKIMQASKQAGAPEAAPPLPTNLAARKIVLQNEMTQGKTKEAREKAAEAYEKLTKG